ncbi:hypothetical protein OEZ85_013996 [Tetradesmus obliquus]|uniref:Uncharacterized protein n=1 Tax=Tetradesmus obliquus TaxID=3088 RepID=A0ABY8U6J6_TETOB|nr:hypothetical protein OEZ85_013996 [Tetradesmus obliquus]
MWVLLLKRVNSYQEVAAEAARQLPLAAAAVAGAAPSLMAFQSCVQAARGSSAPIFPQWSGSFEAADIAQVAPILWWCAGGVCCSSSSSSSSSSGQEELREVQMPLQL